MKFAGLSVLILVVSAMGVQAQSIPNPTTFHCVPTKVQEGAKTDTVYATVARRGTRQTPPMILWRTTLGKFSPQDRCKVVSDRLSEVVAKNDGRLKNVFLTHGRVDQQPVICHVQDTSGACNRKNLLFTLRNEDKGSEKEILQQLVSFSVTGTGSAIQQSEPQVYAAFGEEAEKLFSSNSTSGI